jgi:hypothetical protein
MIRKIKIMDNFWDDEIEDKGWGSIEDETKNLMKDLNISIDIPKPKKKEVYTKKFPKPTKWNLTVDLNDLKDIYEEHKSDHKIIPHHKLLKSFRSALYVNKIFRINEIGMISETGKSYFYLMDAYRMNKKVEDEDYRILLGYISFNESKNWGFRHLHGETLLSNDGKEFSFYTDKGLIHSNRPYRTKNVAKNYLPKIRKCGKELSHLMRQKRVIPRKAKQIPITDKEFSFMLLMLIRQQSCRLDLLSVSEIDKIVKLWDSNKYPKTLWGYHYTVNEITEKWNNPIRKIMFNASHYKMFMECYNKNGKII